MTDVFILDCTEDWRQLQKQQTQRALKQPLSLNPIVHTRQRMWRNHFGAFYECFCALRSVCRGKLEAHARFQSAAAESETKG